MYRKFASRKFILAVVTAILIILNEGLGLGIPEEAVKQIVNVILGWIIVEGANDAVNTLKKDPVALFDVGGAKDGEGQGI